MGLRRFYTERDNIRVGSSVKLNKDEAAHIYSTLRMEEGDHILLFNGDREYVASITHLSKKTVMVEVINEIERSNTSTHQLTLFQSLIKPSNFELVLQKSTELGVERIVPMHTEFGQIKPQRIENKHERWRKIILEACKQSERVSIPQISDHISFNDFARNIDKFELDQIYICTNIREEIENTTQIGTLPDLLADLHSPSKLGVVIGPEGGFSPAETKLASDIGLTFCSFNLQVLRSETAAIAATAIVQSALL